MAFITVTQNQPVPVSTKPIGPLSSLYQNRYQSATTVYPRDLGTSYRGHYVRFKFVSVKAAGIGDLATDVGKIAAAGTGAALLTGAAGVVTASVTNSVVKGAIAAGATALASTAAAGVAINNSKVVQKAKIGITTGISINPPMDLPGDTVLLYMPETLEFNYHSDYSELSLAEAAGSIPAVGILPTALTSILTNNATKLALSAKGYVFNPQQQLLFNGINFREYSMTFTFTPYSQQEAEAVKKIIQIFRKNAAPTVVGSLDGFFFNPPGMVDVSFMFDNKENKNLNKLKRSVIQSVQVNYAPNGWAAMKDGMPMQTTMTVNFKETELVDSKDIDKGY
mgnify:CR=1 FL=1